MTIKQLLLHGYGQLKKDSDSSKIDTDLLMSETLKKNKTFLYSHGDEKVTKTQEKRFRKYIARRKRHEPIAYIINRKEFFGFDFYCDKRALIPRPETEVVVDEAIKYATKIASNRKVTMLDIGTGTGCIAISVAKHVDNIRIDASDICARALKVAEKNINRLKVKGKVKLVHSDLFEKIDPEKKYDIITANLPYLTLDELKITEKEIRMHEPKKALLNSKTEDIYERFFNEYHDFISNDGIAILEINPKNAVICKKYAERSHSTTRFTKDLCNKNRVIIVK